MKNTILLFLLIFIIICFLKTSRNSNENFYNKDKLTGIMTRKKYVKILIPVVWNL